MPSYLDYIPMPRLGRIGRIGSDSYPPDPEPKPDIIYYWRPNQKHGFLSMWYPSPFRDSYDPSKIYPTAEHYYLHHRALLFDDPEIAAEVLRCKYPHDAKDLMKKLKNFDQTIWENNRERILYEANWHKFTAPYIPRNTLPAACEPWFDMSDEAFKHSKRLKAALLETGDRHIVQTSVFDYLWGNGICWMVSWQRRLRWGLNLQGIILMQIRDRIRRDEEMMESLENWESPKAPQKYCLRFRQLD
ncbi:DUF1768-domain-containing protein [Daldinia vernicosa]|uniref:DUF1768-domain-containing protein n=1 Tax=Daldinia vernicosa TaxID=114800 RepID=UPI002007DC77|nr:DUF1768-domain-containing protein [Daldinia vernicosa]KAI0852865.1 DUF1768-domain-containing protein [Daldinia vernicosa]